MLKKLAIVLTMTVAAPAFAATQTWNFTEGSNPISGGAANGNSIAASSGGVGLTITGWSDTGGASDDLARNAELAYYSNTLGIKNRDEKQNNDTAAPQHSIDNIANGCNRSSGCTDTTRDYDMVLLEFNQAVNLSHVDIGWATDNGGSSSNGYADMSFAAITAGDLNGKTWAQILSGGQSSSQSDVGNGVQYNAISGFTDVFSNYWLVGAYNNAFGYLHNAYNDGAKLSGIKTSTRDGNKVPAPSSLLLLMIGLLSLYVFRKPSSGQITA